MVVWLRVLHRPSTVTLEGPICKLAALRKSLLTAETVLLKIRCAKIDMIMKAYNYLRWSKFYSVLHLFATIAPWGEYEHLNN